MTLRRALMIDAAFWRGLPLGLIIYMTPLEFARPLVIARGLFFILTFALSVPLFSVFARRDGSREAAAQA